MDALGGDGGLAAGLAAALLQGAPALGFDDHLLLAGLAGAGGAPAYALPQPTAAAAAAAAPAPAPAPAPPAFAGDPWHATLAAVGAFVGARGRLPRTRARDDPDEVRLGKWVARQRQHRARMQAARPERHAALCAAPWWSWGSSAGAAEGEWAATLAQVGAWVEAAGGEWPSRTAKGAAAAEERRLGSWVHHQRGQRASMPARRPERAAALAAAPWWRWEGADLDAEWHASMAAVCAFVAERGRWPRTEAKGDDEERRLGRWVNTQRVGAARMREARPDRAAALDAAGWWEWRAAWRADHEADAADALVSMPGEPPARKRGRRAPPPGGGAKPAKQQRQQQRRQEGAAAAAEPPGAAAEPPLQQPAPQALEAAAGDLAVPTLDLALLKQLEAAGAIPGLPPAAEGPL